MSPTFAFDIASQRFRYTSGDRNGQYVSQAEVKRLVDQDYIRSQKNELAKIGDRLISGELDLADWEAEVSKALKILHINAYTLGKGGLKRLTPRDYGTIGAKIKKEYVFLRNFTQDIAGKDMSIAQFQHRLSMYVDSAFATYQQGRTISHRNEGYQWYRNIRHASESCTECIEISAKGWGIIGSYPAIGLRKCKAKDRCDWDFYFGDNPPQINRFLLDYYAGWVNKFLLSK